MVDAELREFQIKLDGWFAHILQQRAGFTPGGFKSKDHLMDEAIMACLELASNLRAKRGHSPNWPGPPVTS